MIEHVVIRKRGMEPAARRTVIAHSLLRMRELRLEAARGRRHGLQIMSFEQLAARLTGGLAQPVDDDALREAITAVLPATALGELDGIRALPGMVGAAAVRGGQRPIPPVAGRTRDGLPQRVVIDRLRQRP